MSTTNLLDLGLDKLPAEISVWFEATNVVINATYEVEEPQLTPEQEKLSDWEKLVHTAAQTERVSREQKAAQFAESLIEDCASRLPKRPKKHRASIGHVNSLLYIACQWHGEQELALPTSLLRALACVLELVEWHPREKEQAHEDSSDQQDQELAPTPKEALRECLGLPNFRAWPKLVDAARLKKGNPGLKNVAIAARVGVSTKTLTDWKHELIKYADANDDYFFPLGTKHMQLSDNIPALTSEEVKRSGDPRRPQQNSLQVQPRVNLFEVALHQVVRKRPPSEAFLTSLLRQLDLIGTNGRPVPAAQLVDRLFSSGEDTGRNFAGGTIGRISPLGPCIKLLKEYRLAFSREATELIAKYQCLPPEEQFKRLDLRMWRWEWAISEDELAAYLRCSKDTVLTWRRDPRYREIVRDRVLLSAVAPSVWAKRNSLGGALARMIISPDESNR